MTCFCLSACSTTRNYLKIYTAGLLETDKTSVSALLVLQDNNKYYFKISSLYEDDMLTSNIISCGKYTVKGRTIVFEDKNNGYTFRYKNKGEYLVGDNKKPFFNLGEVKLEKWTEKSNPTEWTQEDAVSIRRQRNNDNNNVPQTFSYGTYVEQIMSIELKLRDNNTYSYSIGGSDTYYDSIAGYVLSEGTFSRNGNTNELILYDTNMKHYFYVFITENGLIENIGCYPVELIDDKSIPRERNEAYELYLEYLERTKNNNIENE